MGVTIKDVAKKTGLSITTISLVLNKKESRIPEKTRQLIEEAVQELHYAPNQAAVSLSTKKTSLIALIIPRKTPWFPPELVSSIESSCRGAGYSLNLSLPEGDPASSLEAIREAMRRGTDGVIFNPSGFDDEFYKSYVDMILSSEVPVCSLAAAGAHILPNSIIPDHRKGGYLAASHLLGLGHAGIGFISGKAGSGEDHVVSELQRGIEDAVEEYGADAAALGHEGLEELLVSQTGNAITGIIASSDEIALGILRRANELGIPVPERLSVISYGNIPPGAGYQPPLSAVSINYDRIARKALAVIKKLSQGESALTPELIPPLLTLRGSTGRKGD